MKRLAAKETWFSKRLLLISWTEHLSSDEVLVYTNKKTVENSGAHNEERFVKCDSHGESKMNREKQFLRKCMAENGSGETAKMGHFLKGTRDRKLWWAMNASVLKG